MKIAGIISSPSDPASRVRILQYVPYFKRQGEELLPQSFLPQKEKDPPAWSYSLKKITGINEWRSSSLIKQVTRLPFLLKQYQFDLIWQNRMLLSGYHFMESHFKKPVVFDFDDAIWLNEGKIAVEKAISDSAMIFAGNEYLADYAKKLNTTTHIIPSVVDTDKLFPLGNQPATFTIGWIGTKSNFQYLDLVKPAIVQFLNDNKDSRLIIVSSEKPGQFIFDDQKIIFRPWQAEKENDLINDFSIGIMPLAETEWTKGKCGYKMLQYMACGKPVVVSPVGVNTRILSGAEVGFAAQNETDWLNAFHELYNDKDRYQSLSVNAVDLIQKEYSCNRWTPQIINLFKKIVTVE
jgi:glycosyltransferase involved in cell wall biosynthesis